MGDYQLGSGQSIPLSDYAPDLPVDTPGILLDSNNAIPTTKGYQARNAPVAVGSPLPGTPIGGYIAYYNDQSTSILAATATHLYRLVGGVWTVADTTGPFSVPAGTRVRFTQFNDDVIAVANSGFVPQRATGNGATFSALPGVVGSPPSTAMTVLSVGGTVIMYQAANWTNSAFGQDTSWTPDVQTLAATGTLYDFPGPIVAAAPMFRAQIVFKENAIWLGTFAGPPFVWNFQLISAETGTWGQECVAVLPDSVAFLGIDDFYITNGYTPTRIPNNIRRYFFNNVNMTYISNTFSWYDDTNATVYWHWVSNSAPFVGVPDRWVAFNVRVGKWSTGYLSTAWVINNSQPNANTGYYFDTNNQLYTWTGTPTTMMLKTGYIGSPSLLSQLLRVRATYANYPTSQTLLPFSVYILGQTDIPGQIPSLGNDDWFNFRQSNRYHRVQLNTVGPCEVQALAYEGRTGGAR